MSAWEALKPGGFVFDPEGAGFPAGTDSFVLTAFARIKRGQSVLDLGSGSGLLGLLLLQREPTLHVTGIELRPEAVEKADETAAKNGLEDRLKTIRGDIAEADRLIPAGAFDLCLSNPPYFPAGSGRAAATGARQMSRGEGKCTPETLSAAAARALRWGGHFYLVHRPERLADLICALRADRLEPKELALVRARPGADPSLILIDAVRGGKSGLKLRDLTLKNADGSETDVYRRAYFRSES